MLARPTWVSEISAWLCIGSTKTLPALAAPPTRLSYLVKAQVLRVSLGKCWPTTVS